jgi:integrase
VASVEDSDLDFATYLWLAASTGARRSQMLGLRWADIDFTQVKSQDVVYVASV